jgi:hypothetical protein
MVAPGFFVVHDGVIPPLKDGDYQLVVSQTLSVAGSSIDPISRSFQIVGPRYTLPPNQALSVFPPANASGAFADRLPQIVLRRRTLPYERTMSPSDPVTPAVPWLALVVLADGEGQLVKNQPLDASLPEQDDKDAPVRDVLRVSERVVQAVFPTKEDLPWLTHVREVDLSDTELALGDDDGWLAVVVSNRLPVPGPPDTADGPLTARHYTAFLVSLEGHEDDLPTIEVLDAPQFVFTTSHVYSDIEIATATATAAHAQTLPLQSNLESIAFGAADRVEPAGRGAAAAALNIGGLGAASASLAGRTFAAAQPAHPVDAWSASTAASANRVTATSSAASIALDGITGSASFKGNAINPIFYDPLARIVEFTVLTSWSFTSQPEGDFRWLMQHLDVGMLGTPPQPPIPSPRPPAPDPRPPLQVLDTGHVTLSATTRRGEPATVWYRGPLTPRAILRPAPDDPAGVLAHAADQLRQVGPDGLENDSLAIAFEIGRMLVASQPGVIAALLNWRRDGYRDSRLGAILSTGTTALHRLLAGEFAQATPAFSAGVIAGVLGGLGTNNASRLGLARPLVDPAPLEGLGDALATTVAQGFGLDVAAVAAVLGNANQSPAAAGGIPSQVTQPSVAQDFANLGTADFVGARLGLQSKVIGILGPVGSPPPVLGPIVKPIVKPIINPVGNSVFTRVGPVVSPPIGKPVVPPFVPPIVDPVVPPIVKPVGPPVVNPVVPPFVPPIINPVGPPIVKPVGPPVINPVHPVVPPILKPAGETAAAEPDPVEPDKTDQPAHTDEPEGPAS